MDFSGMDGPIQFNREVRQQVFEFFEGILRNYPDPVYYENIRGHVSKASLPVKKYVASKCKGEKLLDYFRLRKNYFTVEGTDVLLLRKTSPKRKRVQSECVSSAVSRGRKKSWNSDGASCKRSFSCSSTVSNDTYASSCVPTSNINEKLEHEDYVNKFFCDLVTRHGKLELSSFGFDELPKKVKRHLDLYYKKKVANYFADFPDKYEIHDDWKVSLNLHLPKDSFTSSETKSGDTLTLPNSATENSSLISAEEKSIDPEIQSTIFYTDAVLFFLDILTMKKTTLTVQNLGGYLSQAPKELRSFLKFNYKSFKNFFEESSFIFFINSGEEVTLSQFSNFHKSGIKQIRKIAMKATIGEISLQTMKEKVEELRNKMKNLFSDNGPDMNIESSSEVVAETQPADIVAETQPADIIAENQPPLSCCKTMEVGSGEPNSLDKKDKQIDATTSRVWHSIPNTGSCSIKQHTTRVNVDILKQSFEAIEGFCEECPSRADGFIFEINDKRYERNGNPYKRDLSSRNTVKICKIVTNAIEDSNTDPSETFYVEKTYKFLLMIELLCLEMAEKDLDFTNSHEVKAIEYFIEVLNQPILKSWDKNSLQGTLGRASKEVSSFISKKYKGSNFVSFFQKHLEFEVYPPIIKLSASYKETFSERIKDLSVDVNRNSKWDLMELFESSLYKTILREIFFLFDEIFNFLKKKLKAKLTRLEGIVKHFPICLDWIKALEGETFADKTRQFLQLFDIFEFPSGDYISFELNDVNNTLMAGFQIARRYFDCPNGHIDLVSTFMTSQPIPYTIYNGGILYLNLYYFDRPLRYHELARYLSNNSLKEHIKGSIDSRYLIGNILRGPLYFLQNGDINVKTEENHYIDLNSAIDNSLIKNEEFQSQKQVSKVSDEVTLETSNGQVSNIQGHCNENTLWETIPINISVKSQNSLNDDFKNNSECVIHNSPITVCKESDMASVECKKDFKNVPLYENTDQTDSTGSVKDCIEKLNADSIKNSESSFDVCDTTCNHVPQLNRIECEKDFDSSIDVDSLIALGEAYSLSNFNNEELSYSDEKNNHDSTEQEKNHCFTDISNQFVDISEKESIDAHTVNLNDTERVAMGEYLELLNIDNEVNDTKIENDTKQKDACNNALNEAIIVSEVSFSSDLNCSKTKMELLDKPDGTGQNVNNQINFTKVVENKNIPENQSEMKYKAELLAKEFLQDKFHEIVGSKIFVASTEIFEFKKKYLQKTNGPFDLKSAGKTSINSEAVPNPIELPISVQNSTYVPNSKPTANKDNHNIDIPFKNIFQNKSGSVNNVTADRIDECPLQGNVISANEEKSADFNLNYGNDCPNDHQHLKKNNLKQTEKLKVKDLPSVPSEYPLQPISAEIVLLTSDSCIAVANIDSRKQNIYFLKCVFVCEDPHCCSDCFNDLKVNELVSCFVPPTEISRKMWVAFMVSRETGSHFNEIDSFNEVFIKQNKWGSMHYNMCVNSKNALVQTEHSSAEVGCQVKCLATDKTGQTHLSGDVKLCTITKDSVCQVTALVESASTQTTVNEINSSGCQTDIIDKGDTESQTYHTGDIQKVSTCAEMSCQTNLSGNVRAITNIVETECQTISTGNVMITKYFHL